MPVGTPYESLTFDRHDIVLLQESYPDITPVAGILATQFSTPLSHVNLRANAWGIPNAGDKKARDKFGKLDGKIVYYEVTDTAIVAARGDRRRDQGARGQDRRGEARRPAAGEHRRSPRLAMLTRMRAKDVASYGTKTANLGEIVTANLAGRARAGRASACRSSTTCST